MSHPSKEETAEMEKVECGIAAHRDTVQRRRDPQVLDYDSLDHSELKDYCMLIVGTSDAAVDLARRRKAAGGRFVLLWTAEKPKQQYTQKQFVWRTPPIKEAMAPEVRKMRIGFEATEQPRVWCKYGPDIIELQSGEWFDVCPGRKGALRVMTKDGDSTEPRVVWEMSGVVYEADSEDVKDVDPTVSDVYYMPMRIADKHKMLKYFIWMVLGLTFFFYMSSNYEGTDTTPWWRLAFILNFGFCFATANVSCMFGTALCGFEGFGWKQRCGGGVFWASLATMAQIVPLPGGVYLSNFWVSTFAEAISLTVHVPFMAWQYSPSGVGFRDWNWKWFISTSCAFVLWVVFYIISMVFIVLVTLSPVLANTFLPVVTVGVEMVFCIFFSKAYKWFCFDARLNRDMRTVMFCCLALTHGWAESVRLTMCFVAAVNGNNYTFLQSTILSWVLNLATRFGWIRSISVRTLMPHLPKVARLLLPNSCSKYHDEIKFTFGYPRFAVFFGLALARLINGEEHLLFNNPGLVAVVIAFVLELCEDLVCHFELLPYAPSPHPSLYSQLSNSDPMQLYCFYSTGDGKAHRGSVDLGLPSTGTTWTKRFMSELAPGVVSRLGAKWATGKPPRRHISLHGVELMNVWGHFMAVTPTATFTVCLLGVMVGTGYLSGMCPHPLEPQDRIYEALFLSSPVQCTYPNGNGVF